MVVQFSKGTLVWGGGGGVGGGGGDIWKNGSITSAYDEAQWRWS